MMVTGGRKDRTALAGTATAGDRELPSRAIFMSARTTAGDEFPLIPRMRPHAATIAAALPKPGLLREVSGLLLEAIGPAFHCLHNVVKG